MRNSYLQTCGGHVIKTNSNTTIVENSILIEGSGKKCDTGNAIHNNSAKLIVLKNVFLKQLPSKGNTQIFSVRSLNVSRCRNDHNGDWVLKGVTIVDEDPRRSPRYSEKCPVEPGNWKDLGGNTYNKKPLFSSDGKPFVR